MATVLIALLPKGPGGTRPIGIFATIVRVFMRWARRAYTDKWERGLDRPFWFGLKGATLQHAVWRAEPPTDHNGVPVSPPPRRQQS